MTLPAIILFSLASIGSLFWLWIFLKGIISRKIKLPHFLLLYYLASLIFYMIKNIPIDSPDGEEIEFVLGVVITFFCFFGIFRFWRSGEIRETVKILEAVENSFSQDSFEKGLRNAYRGRLIGSLILKLFGKRNARNFITILMFFLMSALNIYTAFYLKEGSVQKFNREFNSSDLEIIFRDTTVKWINPKGVKVTLTLNSDGSARLLAESEQQKRKRKGLWWIKAPNIHCVKWVDKKEDICRPIGIIKTGEEALSTNVRGMNWSIVKK